MAGVVWQTVHYLVGFQRLGFDVYYVEAHARTPSMLMRARRRTTAAAMAAGLHRRRDAPLRPRRPLGVPRACTTTAAATA